MKKLFMVMVGLLLFQGATFAGEEKWVKLSEKTLSVTPETEVFSELRYVKQDKWGNVFAVDLKESKIAKFDKNMKFIKTIGRKGKGPGEFVAVFGLEKDILQVMPSGDIWISDTNPGRFVVYSNDGKPKKEIRLIDIRPDELKRNIYWHVPATENTFSALSSKNFTTHFLDDAIEEYLLIRLNHPKILYRTDTNEKKIKMEYKKGIWVLGTKNDFFGDSAKVVSDGQLICIMFSQRCEAIIYHEKTGESFTIKRNNRMGEFSDKELAFLKIQADKEYRNIPGMADAYMDYLRSRKNVVMDVLFHNGKIIMLTVPGDIAKEDDYIAEIWDNKGLYQGEAHFPVRPVHINGDHLYTLSRNEEDDPVIVRYRMKFNNQ